jgi:hypothetical protein
MLIAAFVTSNLILQALIAILSRSFKYTVQMTYNHVSSLPTDYHMWSRARILAVYFTAPASCLLLGILLFVILIANPEWISKYRLFVFWLMVCMVNVFLANLVFAPLGIREELKSFYLTFAIVGTWLYLPQDVMVIFSVVSVILSIVWGLMINKEMLRFCFSNKIFRTSLGKNQFVFQLFLAPVFLATPALLLLSTEANLLPTLIVIANLVIISLGMFLMNISRRIKITPYKVDVLNRFPGAELLVALAIWICVYSFFR